MLHRPCLAALGRLGAKGLLLGLLAPGALAQFEAAFYSDTSLGTLVLEREDAAVDFAWGLGAPDPSLAADGFSARWTGTVVPVTSETTTFHVTSDAGARLWLDGQLLVDDWVAHTLHEATATVDLTAGEPRELVLEYFEDTGSATVRLEWSTPTQGRKLVLTGPQGGLDALAPFAAYFGGVFPSTTPGQGGLVATPVTGDLGIGMLLTISRAPGSDLLYVGSRDGRVVAVDPWAASPTPAPFLDLSDRVWIGQDSGLLGVAFHPEFASPGAAHEGEVFVYYIWDQTPAQFLRLSRFHLDGSGTQLDPTSEEVLIQQRLTHAVHRGGGLLFGTDGFLYLSIGELGLTAQVQELDELFHGCVLRIDPDQDPSTGHPIAVPLAPSDPDSFTQGYFVPDDNPFIGAAPGALEELYAIGLRNPHRMTLDEVSGSILIGDVGSAGSVSREEIDLLAPGANFGWPFREGTQAIASPPPVVYGDVTDPVLHYPRSEGACVIGGYVYRGSQIPWLEGRYVYGDYTNGRVFAALDEYGSAPGESLGTVLAGLVTFGVDSQDELYVGGGDGVLYRLGTAPTAPEPPATLSQTGVFTNLANLTIAPGFLPFDVNSPLWTDGAHKRRWFAIPQDGVANAPWEKIDFTMQGAWAFPRGSVFVKHFELPLPGGGYRRLETRFMVHGSDGKYYGVTYRWRPDGSDADLLDGALEEDLGNGQTWTYPGREDCSRCHNPQAGHVLGPRTHQLQRDLWYTATGRQANQLVTLAKLNLFKPAPTMEALASAPAAVPVDDPAHYLTDRARSYLASNCAHCHLPDGVGRGVFDARLATPLGLQKLILGNVAEELGVAGAKVVDPQSPSTSMLLLRQLALDATAMPPVGRDLVHDQAAELFESWIEAANPVRMAIHVEYWSGNDFGTLVGTGTVPAIASDWGAGAPTGLPTNNFSLRYSGTFVAPRTATYTFHATSDDGVRLFVDGTTVIDDWTTPGLFERSGSIFLSAGQPVPLVLEYRELTAMASLRLDWSTATRPRRPVTLVTPGNLPPTAYDQNLVALNGVDLPILLEGTDTQQAGLDVALLVPPQHGTLSGVGPEFVYRAQPGYVGPDSFQFVMHDGELESAPGTVTLDVQCSPCGSVTNYCTTSPNSAGPGALISASGTTSVAANDLVLEVDGAVPGQFGIFYYGAGQTSQPFGDGVRCVTKGNAVISRLPPTLVDGTGHASHALDITTPPSAQGQITGGSTWYFQFWYRDPLGGPVGFNLSDGLEAFFVP